MFKSSGGETNKQKLQNITISQATTPSSKVFNDYNWDVIDEYDPLWPNEYDKLKEKREKLDKERDYIREDRKRRSGKYDNDASPPPAKLLSGFGGRPDDDDYVKSPAITHNRTGGAKIAPPASLQESTAIIPSFATDSKGINLSNAYGSGSVAAKIMAKYGFKVSYIVFNAQYRKMLFS